MTELQFGACSRPTDSSDIRFGTIGRATPGTELRVADTDGKVLAPGEVGELHVRGCSLFSGYVANEEATRSSFSADQWFHTGDLARMDAQGNVQLCGRTKELINRGGVKFNPVDMEIAISAHPSVAQVSIAPIPDPTLGERASCFVVLKSGATLGFEELKAFLAERKFAKFTWPENLAIVKEMPMTPTRKVMKAELVRQYLDGVGRQPMSDAMTFPLPFPKSRADIERIQSERKREAFRLAKNAPWYRGKLDHIEIDMLDQKECGNGYRSSTRTRCANFPTPNFWRISASSRRTRSPNIGVQAARRGSLYSIRAPRTTFVMPSFRGDARFRASG